jgi:hypothetical protein
MGRDIITPVLLVGIAIVAGLVWWYVYHTSGILVVTKP